MCLAIPGLLLSADGPDALTRQGRVSFAGVIKQVNLAYAPDALPGNYVLVHAGFAISVLNEADALKALADLAELGLEVDREVR